MPVEHSLWIECHVESDLAARPHVLLLDQEKK